MKRFLALATISLALLLALMFLFRQPLKELAFDQLTKNMFVAGDTDDFDPGPIVGSRFPGLQAHYQGRTVTLLDDFAGDNGTVLVASRSLDWCPYCMRQMIQLQEHKQAFDAAGITLVAITYDEPVLQQAFVDKFGITIPVLSDSNALSFKTLGILNETYQTGDFQYGIPHPGMIIVDPQGVVAGKLFLESYSSRVDAGAALDYARAVLETSSP